jgi:hypothetical protein
LSKNGGVSLLIVYALVGRINKERLIFESKNPTTIAANHTCDSDNDSLAFLINGRWKMEDGGGSENHFPLVTQQILLVLSPSET